MTAPPPTSGCSAVPAGSSSRPSRGTRSCRRSDAAPRRHPPRRRSPRRLRRRLSRSIPRTGRRRPDTRCGNGYRARRCRSAPRRGRRRRCARRSRRALRHRSTRTPHGRWSRSSRPGCSGPSRARRSCPAVLRSPARRASTAPGRDRCRAACPARACRPHPGTATRTCTVRGPRRRVRSSSTVAGNGSQVARRIGPASPRVRASATIARSRSPSACGASRLVARCRDRVRTAVARPLLGLQRADALRAPLGPFAGLGRGAIALRLAGGGDQHDRHRDREQHRSADREPGAGAGPAPQPGRELVESGEWLVALVGHASGSIGRSIPKHKHRFAPLGVSCASRCSTSAASAC